MMRPAEQFSAWRDELIAEATALADELAAARETLANAERDERVERAAWLALDGFVRGATREHWPEPPAGQPATEGLAGPLFDRVMAAREPLKAAQSARASAQSAVTAIERRLTALRESVDQIDRALTADKVLPLRPALEPAPRRVAPVIDYDTISPAPAHGSP